ncbi:hypothetical protein L7F22_006401 [Adiantum nelumboides]|nr:hypothetical protein [Adiantum nelumboides]
MENTHHALEMRQLLKTWGQFQRKQALFLIDVAANENLISWNLAKDLGLKNEDMETLLETRQALNAHDGDTMKTVVLYIGRLKFELQGFKDEDSFCIADLNDEDVILGMPSNYKVDSAIYSTKKKVEFTHKGKKYEIQAGVSGDNTNGRFANECPQRNPQEKDDKSDRIGKKPRPSARLVLDLVRDQQNVDATELCRAWGKARDQEFLVFIDPGVRANFISRELASKLGIRAKEMGIVVKAGLVCHSYFGEAPSALVVSWVMGRTIFQVDYLSLVNPGAIVVFCEINHKCDCTQTLKSGNFAALVSEQLVMVAQHMAGVALPDAEAWFILESIAKKHNLGSKQLIKLRGLLAYMQQVRIGYWGFTPVKSQIANPGAANQNQFNITDDAPQPVEAAGATRSWVQSMFTRDKAAIAGRNRRGTSDSNVLAANDNIQNIHQPKVVDGSSAALRRGPSSVRTLRGHKAAVTVLHAVTKAECGEHGVDHDDSGQFISGSADCTVKVWDPAQRGSELRATLKGHTRAIRAIASDRVRIVTGSDDQRVLVWDKATGKQLVELKAHNDKISCVRMLWEPCVLTASHDGTVKMWDVRTDTCVATVGRSASAILCLDYDYDTRVLAAAGMDGVCNIWDTQATKQRHKLLGHSKWIRCLRMAGDTVVTGSDDWTVRVWSLSTGVCDSVLTCHSGAITSVEYCAADKGIVTGSAEGMVRMWERDEGTLRCTKNVGIHSASVLSLRIGERWLAIGAADNSMSLFQRSEQKAGGGNRAAGWQLFRTPQRMATVVRCVASDPEKGRICSGARNGLVRLWDAAIAVQS